MKRLVMVANRVCPPEDLKPGGLATAMQAALREQGGIWFGWSGVVEEGSRSELKLETHDNVLYATVDLDTRDHQEYYAGFANRTLWPLFHFRPSLVDFARSSYSGYVRVNNLFADRLAQLIEPDDVVWIHDYHLIPLGAALRERGVRARLGFFLHIPFPPQELLTMLPVHRELFETLAAYDLVGFQTPGYLRAFRDYFRDEIGAETNEHGMFSVRGGRRSFRAGAFPISVDPASIAQLAEGALAQSACRGLRASLDERALVVGVDRLDYSKGLPERFKAFGQFLHSNPDQHRRVTLLQIAPASRGEVSEYRAVRRELERIAGAINGHFAEPDWAPIRYVNKPYQHTTLMGFYRLARVGLVTPLRDGMNLVAKEFVAAQDPDDPGVLVLSRFAGAAHELSAALLVNPYDIEGVAGSLRAALTMSLADRRARWRDLMGVIERYDVTYWRRSFLNALAGPEPAGDLAAKVASAEVVVV